MSVDMYHVNRLLVAFLLFVMTLIRCGCLVLFAPFLSSEVFSTPVRIYFAAALAILLVPAAAATAVLPERMDLQQLCLVAGQELMIGMAIGFLATLVFTGVQMAGEIAGQQIGFSMANVVDPMSNVEVPLLGYINMNLTIMLFIAAKLHLIVIYIMMMSYEFVGVGAMVPELNFNHPVLLMSLDQAQGLVKLGVQLALPIMLIMLLNSIVEGFVAKTMPQMNIMVLGMPLRVVLGVTALVFVYPVMCVTLIPPGWQFNLTEMPEGPLGDMLLDLSLMVRQMGIDTAIY